MGGGTFRVEEDVDDEVLDGSEEATGREGEGETGEETNGAGSVDGKGPRSKGREFLEKVGSIVEGQGPKTEEELRVAIGLIHTDKGNSIEEVIAM